MARHFAVQEFLQMVCKLSYLGDIRLGVAEDPKKVQRIAEGSRSELLQLYKPQLQVGMYGKF